MLASAKIPGFIRTPLFSGVFFISRRIAVSLFQCGIRLSS